MTLAELQRGLISLLTAIILLLNIHFPMQFTLTVTIVLIQYKHQHEKHLQQRFSKIKQF